MIVFFLPDLRGGGAERVMLNLLKEFHESSAQEVVLLLGTKTGNLINQIPEGIAVHELQASSALKSVIPFIRYCRQYHPEKVFASLGSSLATALAKPFISKNIEIINRLGNTIGAEKKLFRSQLKRALYIKANQIIAKNSDKVIFQCNYMAEDYIRETGVTPDSYKVIYNPVNTNKIDELSEISTEIDYDYVAVGRLSPQKDYQTLIKAFSILNNQHCLNIRLRILGDGEQRSQLQKMISDLDLNDTVMISGFTDNPYPYIKNAKALISSSLYEGFSNVIVEALCLGTPVIASDCPGANSEVITEGNEGFLFQTSDPEDLAAVIISQEQKIEMLNRSSIASVSKTRYHIDAIFKKYQTYIEE